MNRACAKCGLDFEVINPNMRTCSDRCRFFAKVDVSSPLGCWLWLGAKDGLGYGLIRRTGRAGIVRAHIFSWELMRGPIPRGLCVLHNCPSGDNTRYGMTLGGMWAAINKRWRHVA